MKNYFSALWFWAWFIMWCLHCKNPESLQILSVLPLLLNVRLVSLQIPVWVQAAVYSQQKKNPKNWVCSFLIQLRPGDFVSHWLEVNLPSVVKRCQKNRWSLPKCMQTRWQKYRSYTRIISQQYHTSEHHPSEWDVKLCHYVIDRNILIFKPIIVGYKQAAPYHQAKRAVR